MKDLFEENKIDWTTIDDYQNEGTLSGLCMALAECDKLLNYILNSQNYQGRTIYEKISQARARFSDLNSLAKALEIKEDIFSPTSRRDNFIGVKFINIFNELSNDINTLPASIFVVVN